MRGLVSGLAAATLLAAISVPAGAQTTNRTNGFGQPKPCVVTGWTDWSLTRPIFKCPEEHAPANLGRRRR